MSDICKIKNELTKLFGAEYSVLFGRARSGLYALMKILGGDKKLTIVLPSNICPVMFVTPWAAQAKIILAPVNKENGQSLDDTYASIVQAQSGRGIVMVTHLYGCRVDYPKTSLIARDKGWFVLENDTLFTGAVLADKSKVLSMCDAVLTSFGYSKTIEAGGGGAILTNNPSLAKELEAYATGFKPLEEIDVERDNWANLLRRHFRQMPVGSILHENLGEKLLTVDEQNIKLSFPERLAEPLLSKLNIFPQAVKSRQEIAAIWNEELKPYEEFLKAPSLQQLIPWRLIRAVDKHRDIIVNNLREAQIDAGTNYPPLWDSFPSYLKNQINAESESWSKRVLNLWVTEDYNIEKIRKTVGVIEQAIEQCENDPSL